MQAFEAVDLFDQHLQQQLLQRRSSHSRLPGRHSQRASSARSSGFLGSRPASLKQRNLKSEVPREARVAQAPWELCFAMDELDCFSDRHAPPLQQQRLQNLRSSCLSSTSFLLKSEFEWGGRAMLSCGRSSLSLSRNSQEWGEASESKRRRSGAFSSLCVLPLIREALGRTWPSKPLRSLDLPGALQQRLPLQQMDWSKGSRCLSTVLLGSVYLAATDASCSPVAETLALRLTAGSQSPSNNQRASLASRASSFTARPPQSLDLGLAGWRGSSSSPPASLTSLVERIPPVAPLWRRPSLSSPGGVFFESLSLARRAALSTGSSFQSPRVPAGETAGPSFSRSWRSATLDPLAEEGSMLGGAILDGERECVSFGISHPRRVTCLQYSLVDDSLLALGFEGGAVEVWRVDASTSSAPSANPLQFGGRLASASPPTSQRVAAAERDAPAACCLDLDVQSLTTSLEAVKAKQGSCGLREFVSAIAWHPRELLFASAHSEGLVSLWWICSEETSGGGACNVRLERQHSFVLAAPLPCFLDSESGFRETARAEVMAPTSLCWEAESHVLAVGSRGGGLTLFSYEAVLSFREEVRRLDESRLAPPQTDVSIPKQDLSPWRSPRPLVSPSPLSLPSPHLQTKTQELVNRHGLACSVSLNAGEAEGDEDDADEDEARRGGEKRSRLATVSCASTQPGASPPETPVGAALSRDENGLPVCEATVTNSDSVSSEQPSSGVDTDKEVGCLDSAAVEALAEETLAQEAEDVEASDLRGLEEQLEFFQRQLEALREKNRRQLLKSFLPFPAASSLFLLSETEVASSAEQEGGEGMPCVSGAWLLGVQSVKRRCHGGPVWSVSFCPEDSRVLLSAGDEQPMCEKACVCRAGKSNEAGQCSLKAWLVLEAGLSDTPLFQVDLEGSVTSLLWSNLTGELIVAHSCRRPCESRRQDEAFASEAETAESPMRGPGGAGRGGLTVWRYLSEGGRELLKKHRRKATANAAFSASRNLSLISQGPSFPSPHSSTPLKDLALLRPALLLVGAFSEPPAGCRVEGEGRSRGVSDSLGRQREEAAAEESLLLQVPTDSLRTNRFERTTSPWIAASDRGTSDRLESNATNNPHLPWRDSNAEQPESRFFARRSSSSASPSFSPSHSRFREEEDAPPKDLFSACDNATSLVQSGDGKVVAYWSLPAEVIVVWAFPPPQQDQRQTVNGRTLRETNAAFQNFVF